ncbi:fimbrial protein [Serratia fonticola]|uniref:fimbrial protein n=1 Tax=Serratia fonticola TaxID=47917 RepID=UPI00157628E9|nr:fimbrial protein [Serratia fonticola]NTY86741.1 fimbrial protein [Serratia fonticola]NTZ12537.1 fimbrial protein [Serratia fonticola]
MKNYNTLSGQLLALRAPLCLCLFAVAFNTQAVDVQFTATFQAPTCQVSAPPSLDFGSVVSSDIKKGDSLENPLSLNITLTQCAGFLGSIQKPGIKVTGLGNADSGDFLFLQPATSQTVNYGVRLVTSVGEVVTNTSILPVPLTLSNFDGGSASIPLKAALSCGNKCNDAATKGGALNASVTFDFAYQ